MKIYNLYIVLGPLVNSSTIDTWQTASKQLQLYNDSANSSLHTNYVHKVASKTTEIYGSTTFIQSTDRQYKQHSLLFHSWLLVASNAQSKHQLPQSACD